MEAVSREIRTRRLRLSYLEWGGERGPIICLHHLTGHKGSFRALAGRLAPEFRLLAYDLRGRGDSDKPPDGYGFDAHAEDALAFAEALGLESFAVLGHSFGATAGVYFASTHAERVRAMVLLDGGVAPSGETMEGFWPAVRELGRTYASMDVYLERMRRRAYYHPWGEALERFLIEAMAAGPDGSVRAKADEAGVAQDLERHSAFDMRLHLQRLACPVLFVRPARGLAGDGGHVYTPEEAEALVALARRCERADVADVNHYTMLLRDDAPVYPAVRAFLDKTLPARGQGSG